ncbi:hypothetical protein [Pyxidicoccus trucidator]|uniref:hypothetical protein n=1 Tax=Pyxidicoccus trucidator TaxID=2709662 RepID=UPI001967D348|nr:hypothetical protein [Pyxidicoccus trucidator]
MRAESPPRRWAGLALVLLTTGCASLSDRAAHAGDLPSAPRLSPASVLRRTSDNRPGDAAPFTAFSEAGAEERLRRRRATKREQGSSVAGPRQAESTRAESGTRGGVPPGWPYLESSAEVLAPLLECASPAGFVALQRTVDMPRVVESLEAWDAVRLGALGPLDAEAAEVLNRKRASFIVTATEKYGVARAEVFALFILHSAFDDELRHLLQLMARDKQLGGTLGTMGAVREQLERRGLKLSEFPDRGERAGDVLRGLGRAGRDALSTTSVSDGARYVDFTAKRGQLPPPYQEALDAVEQALMEQHFSPGSMALGSFDHLTFGVPLGFFHLAAGTGQGASSLAKGRYEQATRELAPAALLVALYAGGRGARHLSEAGVSGPGGLRRLQVPLSLEGLTPVVDRLSERLGASALGEVVRYIQASREAGLLVAEWGEVGAAALHEARGNVPKAQAYLAEAKSPRAGPGTTTAGGLKRGGGGAAEVREAGPPPEVLREKLLQAELEATGARLPRDVEVLKQLAPTLDTPPRGVPEGTVLWREYVTYREKRLGELLEGRPVEGPLKWEGYQEMRGWFARGLEFERTMVSRLKEDAALPRAQREWLGDFEAPRIETHVGVAKADVRYVDVLVVETRPPVGVPPRVETFSFKSRNLSTLDAKDLRAQMQADARDALRYYGEVVRIRRPGLEMEVRVKRVCLIYEGGELKPDRTSALERVMQNVKENAKTVEVQFQ